MKKRDLKISENMVVHCPTEELANEVLSIADKLGYRWGSGSRYTDYTHWNLYKEKTCYNLTKGLYATVGYYELMEKTIISAKDFIAQVNPMTKE
jgi:hypothetical protein